jgi:sialic acid synthase SpsE/sugar phosphate isomerase/epimerase
LRESASNCTLFRSDPVFSPESCRIPLSFSTIGHTTIHAFRTPSEIEWKNLRKQITIGSHTAGFGSPPLLIAEIGINHNGSLTKAKELVLRAKESGAKVVKFQKRELSSIYTTEVLEELDHFEQGFQYLIPILQECELSQEEFRELKIFTEALGLIFLATPFDLPSAHFLKELDLHAYKVSSADLTNMPLIEELCATKKPLMVSTGMSTDKEIQFTVDYLKREQCDFVLLHCVSCYPVDPQKANLERIRELAIRFDSLVGYSGHDLGTPLSLVATSFGACIIEKHFTLDRTLVGPDHKVSLLPEELQRLAARLREENVVEAPRETPSKKEKVEILQGELLNRHVFRKGVVASCPIEEGAELSPENLALKVPGGNLTGQDLRSLYGKRAPKAFRMEEPISLAPDALENHTLANHSPRAPLSSPSIPPRLHTPSGNGGWSQWGFVVRYHDFSSVLHHRPKLLEFHLTEKDTHLKIPREALKRHQEQLRHCHLVVHCCEYLEDRLFDLCSASSTTRRLSQAKLQRVIEITEELGDFFAPSIPGIVFNCGGMTLQLDSRQREIDEEEFLNLILSLPTENITLLAQNMPPYPWYYGGQWKGHYFLETDELIRFCKRTGHWLCLDLSHAAMAARYLNTPLLHYLAALQPYVRHIHVSDARSIEGEGAQIGEGSVDFHEFAALFADYSYTWIAEIWQGHLHDHAGAMTALHRFTDILDAASSTLQHQHNLADA